MGFWVFSSSYFNFLFLLLLLLLESSRIMTQAETMEFDSTMMWLPKDVLPSNHMEQFRASVNQ